jgi:hypothetical protein
MKNNCRIPMLPNPIHMTSLIITFTAAQQNSRAISATIYESHTTRVIGAATQSVKLMVFDKFFTIPSSDVIKISKIVCGNVCDHSRCCI